VALTLGLAIGINTAVFAVIDAVILRPLPFPAPERLGLVETTITGTGVQTMTSQHGVTWTVLQERLTTADTAVFSTWTSGVNVVANGRPTFARQQRVGAGFFRTLGVAPAIGRDFTADEDRRGGQAAVILSHRYWRALGADASLAGRAITVRGEPHVVVGIMPALFESGVNADVWTPLRAGTTGEGEGENYHVLLRRHAGVTWTQVEAELAQLGDEILRRRPAPAGTDVRFGSVSLQAGLTKDVREPLVLLWAAVAVVLVIACVNIAGLLLARSAARSREIATRLALGGRRLAIVRHLLAESILLAGIGTGLGLVVCVLATGALETAMSTLGVARTLSIDGRVLAAASAIGLTTALAFGLTPAILASRLDVRGALASSTRTVAGSRSRWPRRAVVVLQVALAAVLLASAGVLLRTFVHLSSLDPGYEGRNVSAATISLQDARYGATNRVSWLVSSVLERLRQENGVENAAVSLGLPYERLLNLGFRHLDGPDAAARGRMTTATYVEGEYFAALHIPVLAGRQFSTADTASAPGVVIVNETFARRYFQGASPVGRRIAVAGREREIVGLVGDVQLRPGFGDHAPIAAMPLAYVPLSQANDAFLRLVHSWFSPSFVVRARPGVSPAAAIRVALERADPLLPIASLQSLEEVKARALAEPRLLMVILVTLAGTAVLLAAIGIHGLIASVATERTREMSIRLALGARPAQAVWSLLAPGVALAAAGTAMGLLATRATARVLRSFVWGVSATDAATLVGVAVMFLGVAVIASILPARRVLRLDPADVLRHE
jgi:predicted permease